MKMSWPTKMYWRMREYWSGVVDRFISVAVPAAIGAPSFFVVIWIFPDLEHYASRGTIKFILFLYALAVFGAIAIVTFALFFAGRFLVRTIRAFSSRNKA